MNKVDDDNIMLSEDTRANSPDKAGRKSLIEKNTELVQIGEGARKNLAINNENR